MPRQTLNDTRSQQTPISECLRGIQVFLHALKLQDIAHQFNHISLDKCSLYTYDDAIMELRDTLMGLSLSPRSSKAPTRLDTSPPRVLYPSYLVPSSLSMSYFSDNGENDDQKRNYSCTLFRLPSMKLLQLATGSPSHYGTYGFLFLDSSLDYERFLSAKQCIIVSALDNVTHIFRQYEHKVVTSTSNKCGWSDSASQKDSVYNDNGSTTPFTSPVRGGGNNGRCLIYQSPTISTPLVSRGTPTPLKAFPDRSSPVFGCSTPDTREASVKGDSTEPQREGSCLLEAFSSDVIAQSSIRDRSQNIADELLTPWNENQVAMAKDRDGLSRKACCSLLRQCNTPCTVSVETPDVGGKHSEAFEAIGLGGRLRSPDNGPQDSKEQLRSSSTRTLCRYVSSDGVSESSKTIQPGLEYFNLKIYYYKDRTAVAPLSTENIKPYTFITNRYLVKRHLATAGFCDTFACEDTLLQRPVCLKVVHNRKGLFAQSLDEIRILRYLQAQGDLDLLHCVHLYDFFYYKEHLILVTELLGENLYKLQTSLTPASYYFTIGRLQCIAFQVVRALQFIHSLSIIHCDLKPENIVMKNQLTCEIKVIDFGCSCFINEEHYPYIQSRYYRAPEVFLQLPYDEKIDLWSLGCILVELWTGRVLFNGKCNTSFLTQVLSICGNLPPHMLENSKLNNESLQAFYDHLSYYTVDHVDPDEHLIIVSQPTYHDYLNSVSHDKLFSHFLSKLLVIDPQKRLSSKEALDDPWLQPGLYSDGLQVEATS